MKLPLEGIFFKYSDKGISLATNQQMLPSSMRGYAPVVRGFANSNATVTIRQNGQIIYKSFCCSLGILLLMIFPPAVLVGTLK